MANILVDFGPFKDYSPVWVQTVHAQQGADKGPQYRSCIFVSKPEERAIALDEIAAQVGARAWTSSNLRVPKWYLGPDLILLFLGGELLQTDRDGGGGRNPPHILPRRDRAPGLLQLESQSQILHVR